MIKVFQWGLGAMGGGMARLVRERPGLVLVGAFDRRVEFQGRDLGEVAAFGGRCGVCVCSDPLAELQKCKPDVTLLATGSYVKDVYADLKCILNAGSNCITIAEEMAYAWQSHPQEAHDLDALAHRRGITLLGTGVNPGFVLDALVVMLSGVCGRVDSIFASRVNDLSPFGPTVMRTQGVGATPEAFAAGLENGTIVGHIGFRQSMDMMAAALGWMLDDIQEERQPIISRTQRIAPHVRVEPGQVAGCRHMARGLCSGKVVIELEHPQQVCPEAENMATGDMIRIQGDPSIEMHIHPEIPGGKATVNLAVNMIPAVAAARPGLLSMLELPIPRMTQG